jgi:hypothetical protein
MDEVCVGHRLFPQGLGLTEQAAGDLADGVIALEGQWLGAYTFVSLNLRAVAPLREHGGGHAGGGIWSLRSFPPGTLPLQGLGWVHLSSSRWPWFPAGAT